MPYIKVQDRKRLASEVACGAAMGINFIGASCQNAGELNYLITKIIHGYFEKNGGRYQQINDIVGALDSCKAEFQRRIVAPYEDIKIKENSDV